jgi:YHS domain-containing protein
MNRSLFRLALTVLVLAPLALRAEKPVNTTLFGVAIKGYDPVAYFTQGKPAKGDSDFETEWNGATWRFASAANRDAFKASPDKYTPQYGGYCAWAVSQGYTANIDPDAWKIVNGKLYLNYSTDVQKKWERDVPGHITKADTQWPKLLAK